MIKRFIHWLNEVLQASEYSHPDHPAHDLWKHGLPALKHKFNGHLVIGKRGEHHEDMMAAHGDGYVRGIYHKKTKQFHKHGEASHWMDSNDLMSGRQKMARGGSIMY